MTRIISVQRDLSSDARLRADDFRREMTQRRTLVVNLMSSPGAGKTSLLAATAAHWASLHRIGILVGDIATDRDAQRLAPIAPTMQLTTGGACHLELSLVQRGWESLPTHELDYLFIENVGNLVCPASHDLGEHLRIVVLSTTEGDDKPGKYPKAFRTSQALVISKIDLLPYVPFSMEAAAADAKNIQPRLAVWPISALHGNGVAAWCKYLEQQWQKLLEMDVEVARA